MECNNTSFKRQRRAGLTLVEVLISTSLMAVFLLALNSFSIFAKRSFAAMGNYASLEQRSSLALDMMSKDIRQTTKLIGYTTNTLIFTNDLEGSSVQYLYSPEARKLTRITNPGKDNSRSKVLLDECDQLSFGVYQQNTVPTTFNQILPTNNIGLTKVIQLHWVCSRQIMSAKLNTETVQSAKVVMRSINRAATQPPIWSY